MAFAHGTVTTRKFCRGFDTIWVLDWTDLEVGAANEVEIPGLPEVFRMLKYKAVSSASTITPVWKSVAGAVANQFGHLGTSAATAIALNTEQNLLCCLENTAGVIGSFFVTDAVAASTATVQHRMMIKEGI